MATNDFIGKLKADGSNKDLHDLSSVFADYKKILADLSAKDKGFFSLNVLCILCRNLDKVPSWAGKVCMKDLVTLSVDCVRETRAMDKADRVKTLACIYHIHKHVVKMNSSVPPEQILKLSYMPFDDKILIMEYSKTYWNVLVDRLTFIETLKTKVNITKLLPKLTDDIMKLMAIYEPLQFCTTVLVFLLKKLFYIFNSKELNETFKKIFEQLNQSDTTKFKSLPDKEALNLYVKFNECIYAISDFSSRFKFKDPILYQVSKTCITLLGHKSDIFHCIQNFYLNSFCTILTDKSDPNAVEAVFSGLLLSCENTEKLGYKVAMNLTYPFINQLLRLYIEFNVTENKWKENFSIKMQEDCLKITMLLMKKLGNSDQLLKCENCPIRTGLHDALRLSFVLKHFVTISLKNRTDVASILPLYIEAMTAQYSVLEELKVKECTNYEKCLKKAQTDVHNTAILLNKALLYDYSVQLFIMYLKKEIEIAQNEKDLKNISRGFYNKSICELDNADFANSLQSAYLSYLFAYPDSLSTDKQMSLVIDIKAKTLKSKADLDLSTENLDKEQLQTSLNACQIACKENGYGDLKRFLCKLDFSAILKYEFEMYSKLWPSLVPIAGVWSSLLVLLEQSETCLEAEKENIVFWTLIEVILKSATVVRTIQNEHYKRVIVKLIDKLERSQTTSLDIKMIYATLLLMKSDYDLAEASEKLGWKITTPNMDPDQSIITRTLPDEHKALACAFKSVEMLTDIIKEVKSVKTLKCLKDSLRIVEVYVPLLLLYGHVAHGLQLAHVCCEISLCIDDKESYVRNASTILSHATKSSDTLRAIIKTSSAYLKELIDCMDSLGTAVVFLSDAAMFSMKCGEVVSAGKLIQLAQYYIINAVEKHPEINLDIAMGRLLAAQGKLCEGSPAPSALSAALAAQRHYLTARNTATTYSTRQLNASTIKLHTVSHSVHAAAASRRLALWRRARSAAGAGLAACGGAGGAGAARVLAAVCCAHRPAQAQAIIDNRLKHILGLQPSNETQPSSQQKAKHIDIFLTPKPTTLETMLEAQMFKKNDTSPTTTLEKPRFRIPDFLKHGICQCYACHMPWSAILACQIAGLEASMYYRSKDFDLARSFYDGVVEVFSLTEKKIFNAKKMYDKLKFEPFIADIVEDGLKQQYYEVKVDILLEASFFELTEGNHSKCDQYIIEIQELLTELPKDLYLNNELYNLLCASANVRKSIKKPKELGIEEEMTQLKLSPAKIELVKTPEAKAKVPPKVAKPKLVAPEELPAKNRKVIKLNLDDDEEPAAVKKRSTRKTKIPEPKVAKPAVEAMTPRPRSTRVKPKIVIYNDK